MIKDIVSKNENVKPNDSRIEKLKEIIPNCFDKEGNLDIELLKKEFNQNLNFTKESFELNFLGKSYAKMITGLDTETVIEPDIEHNQKEENKNSENIYISGDNLDALKHLAKTYEAKIKCIYIDPPYNTGNDGFVYNDSFSFTKEKLVNMLDIGDEEAERILSMTSGNSSSHSAWLTMMYSRLYISRQLLKNNGAIFISIDDNESANLKLLCDEIFGEENFVANIIWKRKRGRDNSARWFSKAHEYCFVYSKNKDQFDTNFLELDEETKKAYKNPDSDERGNYRMLACWARGTQGGVKYDFMTKNGKYFSERLWLFSKENLTRLDEEDKLIVRGDNIYRKMFIYENKGKIPETLWDDVSNAANATDEIKKLFGKIVFDTPKPTPYIKRMIELSTDDNDIILDFFSGSATTADAVMQLNAEQKTHRKYILVQIPEKINDRSEAYNDGYKTIDEIGQERIRRAAKKIKTEKNANIDYGFKHYTLKETNENLLNKLDQFDPNLINETYTLYKEYGIDTIVETWKLRDGYEFTTPVEVINCDGYNAYKCEESLYFIEPNIDINNIKSLLEYYSKDDSFVCNKLVLFGYSFKFNEFEMIKNNIKQVKNFKNIDVKVYTRY
ncbi:MAG: site-specific DNA-methyltransferase [Bacilli bacterium]|nr:site-specific DNA-methyltransferase [Bacilli bacterium]